MSCLSVSLSLAYFHEKKNFENILCIFSVSGVSDKSAEGDLSRFTVSPSLIEVNPTKMCPESRD